MSGSAGGVRLTASGGEATVMAGGVARAATGRTGLVKLRDDFHGWGGGVTAGRFRM